MTAGCRIVEGFDSSSGLPFPMLVTYPADADESGERFGPYTLRVAKDAPVAVGKFPLVVISHGTGSSHLVHRNLAAHLARNGFVVIVPEHPGNNRNNNELANTAVNLENRPRLISQVIDWALGNLGPSVDPDVIVVAGHSLGGYTALAVAGGVPTAFAHETPEKQARVLEVAADGRVKGLVLLAPATAWYMAAGCLSKVRVPILMLTAEKDPHTPSGHAEIIKRGLPSDTLLAHRVVPNAGHFSFLSPFPEAMTNPAFAPSQDPPGFDRERFHAAMFAEILVFLRSLPIA